MTTSTPRSSEEVDVVDLQGPQQHDGMVLKVEDQEVEAPQEEIPRCNLGRGRLEVWERGSRPALGQGGGISSVLRPAPPLHLYRGQGGAQGSPRAGAPRGGPLP